MTTLHGKLIRNLRYLAVNVLIIAGLAHMARVFFMGGYRGRNDAQPKRPTFGREYRGKVKIDEIVDDHFAKAKVIRGRRRGTRSWNCLALRVVAQ